MNEHEDQPRPASESHRWGLLLGGAILVAALAISVIVLPGDDDSGDQLPKVAPRPTEGRGEGTQSGELSSPPPLRAEVVDGVRVGGLVTVRLVATEEPVMATEDSDTWDDIMEALESDDPTVGITRLLSEERLLNIASGTRAELLEIRREDRLVRVRPVEGEHQGKAMWIQGGAVRR